MTANTGSTGDLAPILSALSTMQSNVGGGEKAGAHEFLERFQKSVRIAKDIYLEIRTDPATV